MYPSQPPPYPPHAPAPPPYTPHTHRPAAHARRRTAPWRSKTLRAVALVSLLALSGVIIIGMVRQETGTEGFLVGLGLAVFPVPLLVAAFCWLDRVEPEPWRNLAFAFTWGACAATLVALLANGFATDWLAANIASTSPSEAEAWGATVIAPVVEEVVKAAAVLFLYRFRRRDFDGITDGIVIAGITATGFAFTENVLYLGNAFGKDQSLGHSGLDSLTAGTFFLRIIVSPFAHPLFTILTGLAFGITATRYPRRRAARRALALLGLLTAVLLHAIWNGASSLGDPGFLIVYGLFMVPVLITLTWLAIWARNQELLSLRGYLAPTSAPAGSPPPNPPPSPPSEPVPWPATWPAAPRAPPPPAPSPNTPPSPPPSPSTAAAPTSWAPPRTSPFGNGICWSICGSTRLGGGGRWWRRGGHSGRSASHPHRRLHRGRANGALRTVAHPSALTLDGRSGTMATCLPCPRPPGSPLA
ncbi:hypothetical protein Srufu_042170 [Streptomyces libani subsp. rufus]|nr:hypothetical protein Srufu_042170 [Streptomyces libani subsp. rufus]